MYPIQLRYGIHKVHLYADNVWEAAHFYDQLALTSEILNQRRKFYEYLKKKHESPYIIQIVHNQVKEILFKIYMDDLNNLPRDKDYEAKVLLLKKKLCIAGFLVY